MASKYWWVQRAHQTIGKTTVTSWIDIVYVMTTKTISKKKLTDIMTHKWRNNLNETTNVTVRDMHDNSKEMFELNANEYPDAVNVYDEGELAPCYFIKGCYYYQLKKTPKPGDLVIVDGTYDIRTLKLGNYGKRYFGDPTKCKKVIRFN